MVKSSEVGQPPLLAESSIHHIIVQYQSFYPFQGKYLVARRPKHFSLKRFCLFGGISSYFAHYVAVWLRLRIDLEAQNNTEFS